MDSKARLRRLGWTALIALPALTLGIAGESSVTALAVLAGLALLLADGRASVTRADLRAAACFATALATLALAAAQASWSTCCSAAPAR
jgi:hypothetical protein